jgi:hypothetical protein
MAHPSLVTLPMLQLFVIIECGCRRVFCGGVIVGTPRQAIIEGGVHRLAIIDCDSACPWERPQAKRHMLLLSQGIIGDF